MIKSEDVELAKPPAVVSYNGIEFTITSGSKRKVFSHKDYIELVAEIHFTAVDKEKNYFKKVGYLLTAEIEIKRTINRYGLKEDYSNVFEDIKANREALTFVKENKEKWRLFWYGAIIALVAGLIGALPGIIDSIRNVPQETKIVFPKDSIVIYLQKDTLKSKDTSLVRIVSRPR